MSKLAIALLQAVGDTWTVTIGIAAVVLTLHIASILFANWIGVILLVLLVALIIRLVVAYLKGGKEIRAEEQRKRCEEWFENRAILSYSDGSDCEQLLGKRKSGF